MARPLRAGNLVHTVNAVIADPSMTPADLRLWAIVCSGCADLLRETADARDWRATEDLAWTPDPKESR